MQSKIFTPTEQEEFERRLKGEKKNYKIWCRIKPKLIELLELFKLRKKITKLIQPVVPSRKPHKGTGG